MLIQNIVYWLLMLILMGYTMYKYISTKSKKYLGICIIQYVTAIINVASIILGISIDWYMQVFIFIFCFLVPGFIVVSAVNGADLDESFTIKLGDLYARKGRYPKAIEYYKKALVKDENNATLYAKLGRMYKLNGDRRSAFDKFARAIELDRDDYKSYYEIGSIFNDMGKYQDAEVVLNNSLKIRPDISACRNR